MSQIHTRSFAKFLTCGVCWSLLAMLATTAHGQQQGTQKQRSRVIPAGADREPGDQRPPASGAPASNRQPRPQAAPLRIARLSPELEQILQNWEISSSKIKRLTGNHLRYKYDSVFETEKHAYGSFLFEAPDRGYFEIKSRVIGKDVKGRMYKTVVGDMPERWVCNGQEIYKIDDHEKTYQVDIIPPEHRGTNIIDSPLPFLFGMKVEKAKMRYDFELVSQTETQIRLRVKPLLLQDASAWQEAQIILDAKAYLPRAVQLLDPPGTTRTSYVFDDLEVNTSRFFWESDPLKPKLKGYQPVVGGAQAANPTTPLSRAPASKSGQPAAGPPVRSADGASRTSPTAKKTTARSVRN